MEQEKTMFGDQYFLLNRKMIIVDILIYAKNQNLVIKMLTADNKNCHFN